MVEFDSYSNRPEINRPLPQAVLTKDAALHHSSNHHHHSHAVPYRVSHLGADPSGPGKLLHGREETCARCRTEPAREVWTEQTMVHAVRESALEHGAIRFRHVAEIRRAVC